MAIVTSQFATSVLENNRKLFERDFEAASANQGWREFVTEIPSTADSNRYNWFGVVPQMQDTTDTPPDIQGLEGFNFSIRNRKYQAILEIEREAMEDDQLGQLPPRISQLAVEAAAHPGRLALEVLETNPTAYDGVAFFSDSHTNGDGDTVDNNITATVAALATPTVAEMQAAIDSARTTMQLFQDRKGRPMGKWPDTFVAPPQRVNALFQALNGGGTPGSVSPVVQPDTRGVITVGGYKIITNVLSTSANVIYGFYTAGSVKPIIFQSRVKPTMESVTDPNSEMAILRGRFLQSVRARHAVGVGDYSSGIKITLSE